MKFLFFCILSVVAILAFAGAAAANPQCRGCTVAADAYHNWVGPVQPPDFRVDCFRVLVSDDSDSASVTVWKGNRSFVIPLPRGAFTRFGGSKPAICLLPGVTAGATKIVAIPGSKEGCATLDQADIVRLRREHIIEDYACMRTAGWCSVHMR